MASINKKDGSPFWWAWYRDANGKQSSKSTDILREPEDPALVEPNRKAAQQIADYFQQQAKAGLPVNLPVAPPLPPQIQGIPGFHEFTRAWVHGVGGDEKYHGKLNLYFDNIDVYLGNKASFPMCRLHQPDFIGLAPFLLNMGYSATTATCHLRVLRQAFLAAVAKGYALISPITPKNFLVNGAPILPTALNTGQIEHLINSTFIIDWRTTLLFGFYFGMDLMPAVSRKWEDIDFVKSEVSWTSFNRAGNATKMVLPIHPLVKAHLVALKKVAMSAFVTSSLCDLSDTVLRERFQGIVQISQILTYKTTSGRGRKYSDVQFASLKLAFALQMGHTGLLGLAPFLRSMSPQELATEISKLPSLNLKPLPLLI